MRIAAIISYDGTSYCGWQKQENGISVQGKIEDALFHVTGEKIQITGAGRTDAGVHALGQVAHFDINCSIPPEKFSYAINSFLPADIRIKESFAVSDDFHSRFDATGKKYKYLIYNSKHASALLRNFSMHEPRCLDFDSMNIAAEFLKGEHDFSSFCAAGAQVKSFVRELYDIEISVNKDIVEFVFYGNGFLYNMVRIMVGTLIYVGIGKIQAEEITTIIEARDRTLAGITVPPQGLFLEKVYYKKLDRIYV